MLSCDSDHIVGHLFHHLIYLYKYIKIISRGVNMDFMPVVELKKTRDLWDRLDSSREIVITRDGRPMAILVGIQPEELENVHAEIRRSLFSATVTRIREQALDLPDPAQAIDAAINASRTERLAAPGTSVE
jgi:antitoxin (DNA-binding transcriptional repressor) of toxin-antitoxin stability system